MADFYFVTDENGVTKYVKDSEARTQLTYTRKDLSHMVTIVDYTNYGGKTYIDGVGWRDVVELNHFDDHGVFSPEYNGSCLRLIFVHSDFYDGTLPLMFYFFDPTDRLYKTYPVYRDIDRTIPMLYQEGDILDFVYEDTNHCFYLVDVDQGGGTIEAEDVAYDNTASGLAATDVQAAIDELADEKVDKVSGKGLSEEDFTTTYRTKLDSINAGAEVNVQSNWTEADTTSDAYIRNKPSLATVATSGDYGDLINKPTIPAAQVNSDWNAGSGVSQILNKPSLATVATSGSYSDLSNKPTIPAAQVNSDWNANSGVAQILNKPSLAAVATSGDYDDLTNKPTIPGDTWRPISIGSIPYLTGSDGKTLDIISGGTVSISPVTIQGDEFLSISGAIPDWDESSYLSQSYIRNKPTLATVATSGSYNDLTNTPTIPSGVDTFVDASLPSTTGTDFSGYSSGRVICPANVAKSIGTVEIAAGYWLLEISAMWYSNGTGYRMLGLSTTKNTFSTNKNYTISQNAVNGVETYQRIAIVVHPTTATRYHIIVKQNVGDIYVSPEYKAIRLEH